MINGLTVKKKTVTKNAFVCFDFLSFHPVVQEHRARCLCFVFKSSLLSVHICSCDRYSIAERFLDMFYQKGFQRQVEVEE